MQMRALNWKSKLSIILSLIVAYIIGKYIRNSGILKLDKITKDSNKGNLHNKANSADAKNREAD